MKKVWKRKRKRGLKEKKNMDFATRTSTDRLHRVAESHFWRIEEGQQFFLKTVNVWGV
jgi:hypothetical protein